MFAIIAFCAYCLWRGPMRPFAPCIKKRVKPTKPHRETKADLEDPDGILSPDRAPGPNLAFWRRSKASGDWGHQVYLTDLKRQAEAGSDGGSTNGSGSGVGYDEEAVREANGVPRPKSSQGVNRKSRGMAMGKSPISASPLGADRYGSPRSNTLSHSRLIKARQSSPAPSRSPQLGSASTPSSSPLIHPRRPASTILPSPILPPRQSSFYSPMNSATGGHLPPPRDSSHFSPLPPSFTPPSGRNQYSPATSAYNVAVSSVPSVATTAYSPFAPRNGNGGLPEGAGTGEGGQRDSIRSTRGYAV